LILVFNATFSNISAVSWRPVLVVEEEYPERTSEHGQATGKLYNLRLRVDCTFFVIIFVVDSPESDVVDVSVPVLVPHVVVALALAIYFVKCLLKCG
jgi:hypothetical protein